MLEFLFQVARQFPEEGLGKHALFLFVSLVMRLVNETEKDVKEQVQGVLKCLLGRIPQKQFFEVLDLCMKWIPHRKGEEGGEGEEDGGEGEIVEGEEVVLDDLTAKRRVGFLALSLIVDVCGHAENRTEAVRSNSSEGTVRLTRLIPRFSALLNRHFSDCLAVQAASQLEETDEDDEQAPNWEQLYLVLCIFEKLFTHVKLSVLEKMGVVGGRMWGALPPLVRHRHVWVRGVACRILGICFFKMGEEDNYGLGNFLFVFVLIIYQLIDF